MRFYFHRSSPLSVEVTFEIMDTVVFHNDEPGGMIFPRVFEEFYEEEKEIRSAGSC